MSPKGLLGPGPWRIKSLLHSMRNRAILSYFVSIIQLSCVGKMVRKPNKQFLLVEPIAKTAYPPLGLMKIGSWLKAEFPGCAVLDQVGVDPDCKSLKPDCIYITTLFTWDAQKSVDVVNWYRAKFPATEIKIGGIAASLLPDYFFEKTGIHPHVGILAEVEEYPPDYSLSFGRKVRTSISFTSRGCPRKCHFCTVNSLEPTYYLKENWERDVCLDFPLITFWDNNWLASPSFEQDCRKLIDLGKKVDFNQGIDVRLYTRDKGRLLGNINLDPIRFAFDNVKDEAAILQGIQIAKEFSNKEICTYVLYNFEDTPEELYYRLNLLNQEKVLAFPMEYRKTTESTLKFPGRHWNLPLLRAMKLSLMFYYRKGMITESRTSFLSIYGNNPAEFIQKLYAIYEYDKDLKRKK
jgi:hypothetical protein